MCFFRRVFCAVKYVNAIGFTKYIQVLYLGISIDVGFIFGFTAVYLGATVLMVQGCCKYSGIVKDTIYTAEIIFDLA